MALASAAISHACWRRSSRLGAGCSAHATIHIFLKQVVEFLRSNGFAEISVHSRSQTSLAITSHGVRGKGDHFLMDFGSFFLFPDCHRGLKTIYFGHLQVHENQIEVPSLTSAEWS